MAHETCVVFHRLQISDGSLKHFQADRASCSGIPAWVILSRACGTELT